MLYLEKRFSAKEPVMKVCILVSAWMSAAAAQAATLYVSPEGNNGDGLSW